MSPSGYDIVIDDDDDEEDDAVDQYDDDGHDDYVEKLVEDTAPAPVKENLHKENQSRALQSVYQFEIKRRIKRRNFFNNPQMRSFVSAELDVLSMTLLRPNEENSVIHKQAMLSHENGEP